MPHIRDVAASSESMHIEVYEGVPRRRLDRREVKDMWEHIWIAYGVILFTLAIGRGLSSIPWITARSPEPVRFIVSNTVSTVGMITFAANDFSHPASPRDAYVWAVGVWAMFVATMSVLLVMRQMRGLNVPAELVEA